MMRSKKSGSSEARSSEARSSEAGAKRARSAGARPASQRQQDVVSLMLRLAVGPMLVAHGWNKFFGKGGIAGTIRWFDSLGLKPAKLHARLAAATEIGSGSALALGAASPLPSAAVVGLMATAARTDHKGKGFFVFKGGWEYTGVIALVATAVAALGPGRLSVDGLRGRQRRGLLWAIGAAALGVGSSTLLIASSYRPEAKEAELEASSGTSVGEAGGADAAGNGAQPVTTALPHPGDRASA